EAHVVRAGLDGAPPHRFVAEEGDDAARRGCVRVPARGLLTQARLLLLVRHRRELAIPHQEPLTLAARGIAALPEHGLQLLPTHLVRGQHAEFRHHRLRHDVILPAPADSGAARYCSVTGLTMSA